MDDYSRNKLLRNISFAYLFGSSIKDSPDKYDRWQKIRLQLGRAQTNQTNRPNEHKAIAIQFVEFL